jgi:signal transduction histidine kinase
VSSLPTRSRPLLAVVVFASVVAITVAIVLDEPSFALPGDELGAFAAELVAATLVTAAAAVSWRTDGPFAILLAGAASAWLVAEWSSPAAGLAFTSGLVLYAAWAPLLATAALRGLDGRPLDRPARILLWVAFGSGVGLLGVASTMVFDPAAQGCTACPANLLLVVDAPTVERALGRTGLALTVAWASAYAVLATVRVVRASPARRRWSAPVLAPAALAVLLWGADALHGLERGFVSNDPTDQTLRLAQAGALALVAVGVALARWRAWRTRAALARLVLDIGKAPVPGEVRAWLAESLGDQSISVLYHLEGEEWIAADGHATLLTPPEGRELTTVRVRGQAVLAVVHRPGLLDDPTLLSELVTTARLALEHDRLHAVRRARLEQLRASRARIVMEADLRRLELEHDLHDGAQQRLVAVALAIRLARRGLAESETDLEHELAHAESGVRDAVVQLRDLAHGLFPSVLADEGLGPALEELSERSPRLVPGDLPTGRFPSEVESAAYFATVESLRLTQHDVTVDAVVEDSTMRLVIGTASRFDGDLLQVIDRVGAVGGTVVVTDGQLRVEMPCAS